MLFSRENRRGRIVKEEESDRYNLLFNHLRRIEDTIVRTIKCLSGEDSLEDLQNILTEVKKISYTLIYTYEPLDIIAKQISEIRSRLTQRGIQKVKRMPRK